MTIQPNGKTANRPCFWLERQIIALVLALILITEWALLGHCAQRQAIPHLRKRGTATQLIIDGKPFLILGGELGNSSSSSLDYMRPIWPKLVALHLNTVLVPVYWELLEPNEGHFDFSLVDGLIKEARAYRLRLLPLWFGSWKNSMSCYAPAWVKTEQKRFPRSQDKTGRGMEILSPFSQENSEADARAFAAFMRHLRDVDSLEHTVIMVQVENEIGMIPDSRDRSPVADRLYKQGVPAELMNYLVERKEALIPELREVWARAGFKTQGTWEEVFGHGVWTDEIFMAWHFARYTNTVASRGKAEYPLPMYANAALIRPGYMPGQYPSAGPLPHLMDIWRAGAPQIDFLSPDIYFPNFAEWCRKYQRSGNPLFIPEALSAPSAVNALYAIGQHDAIGFSPFSVDSLENPEQTPLARSYEMLAQLAPLILEHQGNGTMIGLLPEAAEQRSPQQIRLNDYILSVTYERLPQPPSPPGGRSAEGLSGGLVIAVGPDEFLFSGSGLIVTFEPQIRDNTNVGILFAQEGKYVDGRWVPARWLNGDQTHQGRHLRLVPDKFEIQRIKLYRYR